MTAPVQIAPSLPVGLTFDESSGSIGGTVGSPSATVVRLLDSQLRERVISIEIVKAPLRTARFVAPTGDDNGPGTQERPFRTIQRALSAVPPGTDVFIRGGRYYEDVVIRDVQGTPSQPIVLRAMPGDIVYVEGARAATTWERATGRSAASDEWISRETFDRGVIESTIRGAFSRREPYTRLLTYSRLEDLRATNQRSTVATLTPSEQPMAWTYMGPGLWHDAETGRIHVRLSPTTNRIEGLADYTGPTDPSEASISVWPNSSTPLVVAESSNVELRDLVFVGGGETTVRVTQSQDVVFDHVRILAAMEGLSIDSSEAVRFVDGVIDGGIPPWAFRSDFKDDYKFTTRDGNTVQNNLVRKTSRSLLYVGERVRQLEIARSELVNGHDIYLAGIHSSLHHCLIRNIHDEGLFVSHVKDIDDLRIHHNVIQRVLSAVSGVGGQPSGPRYIYRNIFDLRDPTAGYRPGASFRDSPWRWGHIFKGALNAAPLYFYQNTIAVRSDDPGMPLLLHHHTLESDGRTRQPRWFVNNVVVAVGSEAGPFSFVPNETYLKARDKLGRPMIRSDGNAWIRVEHSDWPLFRCLTGETDATCRIRKWMRLEDVHQTGLEAHSRYGGTAGFVHIRTPWVSSSGDDLRPGAHSMAHGIAIRLPKDLPDNAVEAAGADAGALPMDAAPLHIGVDGRASY
ncbi:MAG: DUF1565 domain-containing protein [Kofleriaceae bacterium]